ncbi:SecDF P1 head subdomain-containing protein [Baekduia sp. Peel2402]|uniref:SecDF P1 head subdomain-containing protein n=1 Tax=Baekduia sp. Peel2402 TaxID=3458296 RepID=UPI00403EC342
MLLNAQRTFPAAAMAAMVLLGGLSGCGDDGASPPARDAAPEATRGGATTWTFAAEPYSGGPRVTSASLARTAQVVQSRGDALGQTIDSKVERGRVVVSCDGCSPPTATGRLVLYAWEKDVRSPECKAAPTDPSVTGGVMAGQPGSGSLSYYKAVTKAAANCKATAEPDDTTSGLWYGVDARARAVVCGPRPTAAALRVSCRSAGKRPARSVEVPRGYVVVQAEFDHADKASRALASNAYFILEDDPDLLGRDIKDPEQNTDELTGQPTITFNFTDEGKKKWQKVTREISRRGQAAALPGQPASNFANHFAMVLDDELISVPYIDPQQNPDGIDGENGSQIAGSFTMASAKQLAATLRTGPLPLALRLVREEP